MPRKFWNILKNKTERAPKGALFLLTKNKIIHIIKIPPGGILFFGDVFKMSEHKHTKAVINRLARSAGHLSAVKKMVEEGRDCSEVLIQLSAVKAEIAATEKVILKDHIEHCVADAVLENDEETIARLMAAIDKII